MAVSHEPEPAEEPQSDEGAVEAELDELDAAVESELDVEDASTVEPEPESAVAFHLGEQPEPAPTLTYAGELDPAAGDEARSSVDDLFAKLRTGGPAEVAGFVATDEADDRDAPEGPEADSTDETPEDDEHGIYLSARQEALDPLQASVARLLKRTLTDEQNEVLDGLRRAKAVEDLDGLVGDVTAHAERYRAVLVPDLRSAAAAGAASVGVSRDLPSATVHDAVLDEVTTEFVLPLRARLSKALDDAGGDPVEAGATLRAAYREWRTAPRRRGRRPPRADGARPWCLRRRRARHPHPLGGRP